MGTAVKESASDVQADLSTMTIFGLSDAKTVMGSSSSHGKIYANCQAAADFWKQQGKTSSAANCSTAIDPTFIDNA